MDEETLDISESSDLRITAKTRSIMRGIGNWCGVASIIGFIISLGGIFLFFMMFNNFNRYSSGLREDEIIGLLLMAAGITFMILFSRFLWVYRANLKRSISQNSDLHLEKALKSLRNVIIMVSIVFVIAAGFLILFAFLFLYFNLR